MAAKSSVAGMNMGGLAVTSEKFDSNGSRKKQDEKFRSFGNKDTRTPAQKESDKNYATFTNKQKEAFDLAIKGHSIFLSGGGGVGKSHVLKAIVFHLRNVQQKNVAVLATTGVAALNIGGTSTVHRFFQLPIGVCLKDAGKGKLKPLDKTSALLKYCDTVLIEECSMLRIDHFDSIYNTLCKVNKFRESKGLKAVQVLLVGDFFQLPPCISELDREQLEKYYNNPKHSVSGKLGNGYAFNSVNWGKLGLKNIILTEVKRQKDEITINHLNKIRVGEKGFTNYFNHVTRTEKIEDAITLHPFNSSVQRDNMKKLKDIKGREYVFKADLQGEASELDCRHNYELHLKIGAKIIFLINDNPERPNDIIKERPEAFKDKPLFVNGTNGIIRNISSEEDEIGQDDFITIEIVSNTETNGKYVNLKRSTNDVIIYEEKNGKILEKKIGEWTQYGISLAYAVSTHKSQGLSLDKINIDTRNAFAHGMLYVALSRCTSVDGVYLEDYIREEDLIMDKEVAVFYQNLKEYTSGDKEDATA